MLAAKFEYECNMRDLTPVVGGGSNATVIHYSRNDQKIEDGDLVLIDVGCELHGYPSSESATELEALLLKEELYDLILQTNKECLKLCKPGANLLDIHHYLVRMLRKGLKEIGICPTSIGHYLGMDVHDSSTVSYECTLEPGVVITIEPGLYIPSSFDGPERF
ncbi:hypothetical protein LWI29_027939 [Acer saccharum]|uniref:Peptidase M24 domain-containing protein n=1 Tax=Acer saccharum TaxID=4024 RepID=A0AA39W355_ACESA|nr:hypothetical protein LWI29_027939 [Acer saccharum]